MGEPKEASSDTASSSCSSASTASVGRGITRRHASARSSEGSFVEAAGLLAIHDLISQLTDHYFVVRRERIQLAEVSSTGSFVQLDLGPENIYYQTFIYLIFCKCYLKFSLMIYKNQILSIH